MNFSGKIADLIPVQDIRRAALAGLVEGVLSQSGPEGFQRLGLALGVDGGDAELEKKHIFFKVSSILLSVCASGIVSSTLAVGSLRTET